MRNIVVLAVALLVACSAPQQRQELANRPPSLAVAETALANGSPQIALQICSDWTAREPRNLDAQLCEGDALAALGRRDEAEAAFTRAQQMSSGDARGAMGLGRLKLTIDPAAAELLFTQVANRDPNNAAAWNDLGIARDLQGRHAEAQLAYGRALGAAPDMQAAEVNLALSMAMSGHASEAVQRLRALTANPDASPRLRHDLAAALAMANQPEEAAKLLRGDLTPDEVDRAIAGYQALPDGAAPSAAPVALPIPAAQAVQPMPPATPPPDRVATSAPAPQAAQPVPPATPSPDRVATPAPAPQAAQTMPPATPSPARVATPAPAPQAAQTMPLATPSPDRVATPAPAPQAAQPMPPATPSPARVATPAPAPQAAQPMPPAAPSPARVATPAPAPQAAQTMPPAALLPLRPAEVAAPVATNIVLRATADAWLRVSNRYGQALVSQVIHAGDSWSVPADAEPAQLLLSTGNAGGIDITVDGQPVPSLGKNGAVFHNVPLDPVALREGRATVALPIPAPEAAHPVPPAVPLPLRPAEVAAPVATNIVLRATADAWLRVSNRYGQALVSQVIHAGDSWSVPADANPAQLLLSTGNAGGIDITVDGQPVPSLGKNGAVFHNVPLDPIALREGRATAAVPHG